MARLRLRSTPVGDVLLIHPKGGYDDRAAAFASGITEDPLHTLVVVDLPADALVTEWEGVARLLSSPGTAARAWSSAGAPATTSAPPAASWPNASNARCSPRTATSSRPSPAGCSYRVTTVPPG